MTTADYPTTELRFATPRKAGNEHRTVLIVEDSPLDAEIIGNLVESRGATAFSVESYELAKTMTQTLKFDALTVDIQLSEGVTGPELVERLGLIGSKRISQPKVVVLTGSELSPAEVEALKERGFDEVLTKPIDPALLLRALGLPLNTED